MKKRAATRKKMVGISESETANDRFGDAPAAASRDDGDGDGRNNVLIDNDCQQEEEPGKGVHGLRSRTVNRRAQRRDSLDDQDGRGKTGRRSLGERDQSAAAAAAIAGRPSPADNRRAEPDSLGDQDGRRKRGRRSVGERDKAPAAASAIAGRPPVETAAGEEEEEGGGEKGSRRRGDHPDRLSETTSTVRAYANAKKARVLQQFFKTAPGEYGQGDVFLGVTMPQIRSVAARYADLTLPEIATLLSSTFHEERMLGTVTFVNHFLAALKKKERPDATSTGKPSTAKSSSSLSGKDSCNALPPPPPPPSFEINELVSWYVCNRKGLNNWDLVDVSAHHVLGSWVNADVASRKWVLYYLCGEDSLCRLPPRENDHHDPPPPPPPLSLAQHFLSLPPPPDPPTLWDVRIAIVANLKLINSHRSGDGQETDGHDDDPRFDTVLDLAERFYSHPHDLIHKALGWMLREVGKQDRERLVDWLRRFASRLPRVMLRYAIEKLSPALRKELMEMTTSACECDPEDLMMPPPSPPQISTAGGDKGGGGGDEDDEDGTAGRRRLRKTNRQTAIKKKVGENEGVLASPNTQGNRKCRAMEVTEVVETEAVETVVETVVETEDKGGSQRSKKKKRASRQVVSSPAQRAMRPRRSTRVES